MVGAFTANPYVIVAGGLLFAGGFIANKIYESKRDAVIKAVGELNAQISSAETAEKHLTEIVASLKTLSGQYGSLLEFWGRMMVDAGSLEDFDEILTDASIEALTNSSDLAASEATTSELKDAAEQYLDLICSQGISIPEEEESDKDNDYEVNDNKDARTATPTAVVASNSLEEIVPTKMMHAFQVTSLTVTPIVLEKIPETSKPVAGGNLIASPAAELTVELQGAEVLADRFFEKLITSANIALEGDNIEKYSTLMMQATAVVEMPRFLEKRKEFFTGRWFDVDKLRSVAGLWQASDNAATIRRILAGEFSVLITATRAASHLLKSKHSLIEMASNTYALARTMQSWSPGWVSDDTVEQRDAQAKNYVKPAREFARLAINATASINNSFNDFSHALQEIERSIDLKINTNKAEVQKKMIEMDGELRGIAGQIPFSIKLFGNPMEWSLGEARKIGKKYEAQVDDLDARTRDLENLKASGFKFREQTLTWVELAQKFSQYLGFVSTVLESMKDMARESVGLYADQLKAEWGSLVDHSRELLQILGSPLPVNVVQTLALTNGTGIQEFRQSTH